MAKTNESNSAHKVEKSEFPVQQEPMMNDKILNAIDNPAKSSKKRKSNDGLTESTKKGRENKKIKPIIMKDEKVDYLVKKIDETIWQKSMVTASEPDLLEVPVGNQITGKSAWTTEKSPVKYSTVSPLTNTETLLLGNTDNNPNVNNSLTMSSTSEEPAQSGGSEQTVETATKFVATEKIRQIGGKKQSSGKKLDKKSSEKKTKKRHHSSSTKQMKESIDRLVKQIHELEKEQENRHTVVTSALKEILDNWNEHRQIPSDMNSRILEQKVGYPEPGFVRFNDNTIHLGQGIYIPKKIYDTAVFKSKTHAMFAKKMLMTQFTDEELLTHSVTGAASNRVKVGEQKPALDPTRMRAIKDIFEFYLKSRGFDTQSVKEEVDKFSTHVRSRISDARAEQRRQENKLNKTLSEPKSKSSNSTLNDKEEEKDSSEESEDSDGSDDNSESEGSNDSEALQ